MLMHNQAIMVLGLVNVNVSKMFQEEGLQAGFVFTVILGLRVGGRGIGVNTNIPTFLPCFQCHLKNTPVISWIGW